MLEEGGTPHSWRLAVTARCLDEDLHLGGRDWHEYVPVRSTIRAFAERRGQRPIGQERILELVRVLHAPIYSLHSEQARGATWHDQEEDIVWLLAVGEAHDYDYIIALGERGRLMPEVDDYEQFEFDVAAGAFTRALGSDIAGLVRIASLNRDELIEGTVAGRIPVRLCWETSDPDFLTVAVSKRLMPGEIQMPAQWLLEVAAAFFQGVPFEEFPPFPLDFDNTFVRDDEMALRHWAPAR